MFRDVPECSGMLRDVPCSWFYRRPCRSGLRTGRVNNREYRVKGPYVVVSFLLLLFCVLCSVIVNSVLKSRFSIISPPAFRKRQKQRTDMAWCCSPENYYYSGRNTRVQRKSTSTSPKVIFTSPKKIFFASRKKKILINYSFLNYTVIIS